MKPNETKKENEISRREFLRNLGLAGAGILAATSPWLSTFSEVVNTKKEKCRLGIIGPGSRGQFLMSFISRNPKAEITALADIYEPSLESAAKIAPNAKIYRDHRSLLEDKNVDAVIVATPLHTHHDIAMPVSMCIARRPSVTLCRNVSTCITSIATQG